MAKQNTYRNKSKEKEEEKPAPKSAAKSASKSKKESKPKKDSALRKTLRDERTWKISGLLLLALSLFLAVSFLSFYFTHTYDQSFTQGDAEGPVKNWAGKAGALVSYYAVMHLGLGAFILVPLAFFTGLNLLTGTRYISQPKLLVMSLGGYVWLSTLLAAMIPDGSAFDVLHGKFGWGMEELISGWIGRLGLWMALIISIGIYAIIAFNMSFGFVNTFWEKWKPKGRSKPEPEEEAELTEEERMAEAAQMAANMFAPHKKKDDFVPFEPSVEEDPFVVEENERSAHAEKVQAFADELIAEQEEETAVEEEPGFSKHVEEVLDEAGEQDIAPEPFVPPIIPPVTEIPPVIAHTVPEILPEAEKPATEEFVFDLPKTETKPLTPKTTEEPAFTIEQAVEEEQVAEVNPIDPQTHGDISLDPFDPTLDLPHFRMPEAEILQEHGSGGIRINKEELEANKDRIVGTLNNYNIQIDQIKATVGPTVTLYEIVPAPGVRISKIKNLEDDIALSLAALGIRIIAPIPGKGTIGIEVPNQTPEVVSMRSVITSEKFAKSQYDLPIGLGKTISNETYVADLAKMPHLLMAGATGQGKSVGLNAILVSLLYMKHPSQLKFVLVDPKKVELTLFNKIERHYLAKLPGEEEAIITNTQKVINTLNSLCIEMDQRYELLKDAGVRNIKEYNPKFQARRLNPNKGHRYLPYIVLVVDEFADLIMTAGKEVELPIARLAQLARAIGIHLIIATQRPSVNIITGTIKANFPARIAFRVSSKVDSRTILDSGGAEQLIGRGDMLLSLGSDLIRLQCAFVDTPEVDTLTEFIGDQRGYPSAFELPEYYGEENSGGNAEFSVNDKDALFEDAARIIVSTQQGSTSMLQRRLKLGYNRAGRLMDQLEAAGIVGPNEGSKPRQVLIPDEVSLEHFLDTLK